MRRTIAIVAPWLLWALLDTVVSLMLMEAVPNTFDDAGYPLTTAMLAGLLLSLIHI